MAEDEVQATEATPIHVPIPKAGVGVTFEIDPNVVMDASFPEDVLREILMQGLKVLINRGQTKLPSTKGMKPGAQKEQAVKDILAAVEKQWQNCLEGKVRITGGKTKKATGAIKVEAMRIARQRIKDSLKAKGKKLSYYTAKEITQAAERYLAGAHGAAIMQLAEEQIKARESQLQQVSAGIDLTEGLKEDAKLVAKAQEKAAKAKKAKEDAKVDLDDVVAGAETQKPQVRQREGRGH